MSASVDECSRTVRVLLGADRCVWCHGAAEDDLCVACVASLPWNTRACARCASPTAVSVIACPACARRPPAFDAAWTAFVMGLPIDRAIHGLKYAARFDEGRRLGRLMAERLALCGVRLPDLVLPVPLHRGALVRRGYNQAAELARGMRRVLPALKVDARSARRVRATQDQIGRTAAERRRNVRRAFVVERDLTGMRVALLDDVMTTGATLGDLARAAKAAGAAHVEAWAVARVP